MTVLRRTPGLTEGSLHRPAVVATINTHLPVAERVAGTIGLLLGDNAGQVMHQIVIQVVWRSRAEERRHSIDVSALHRARTVVAVLAREDGVPGPWDAAWRQAVMDVASQAGCRVLGVYLATPTGITEVDGSTALRLISGRAWKGRPRIGSQASMASRAAVALVRPAE